MKTTRKGSVTLWLILILIILIALAYYMSTNKSTPLTQQTATSTPFYQPLQPTWVGMYTFTESGPPDSSYTYTVSISGDSYNSSVLVDVDSAKTEERLTAYGVQSGGQLNIIFDSYRPGNQFTPYHQGDWLFALVPTAQPNKYKIIWSAMHPALLSTDPSTTFFTKQ